MESKTNIVLVHGAWADGSSYQASTPRVKKMSAVTFRVVNMKTPAQFYRDVLGMNLLDGGEDDCFSLFRAKDGKTSILNLEQGRSVTGWGRMISYGRGCVLGIPAGQGL